ncbi:hypothetical protein [Mesorhizobium sp. M0208]|uniref:hypothetical protein n=1 Tax=Mesorhizobium sp. M0208 TaxID=2956916 RepID=UPI0033353076
MTVVSSLELMIDAGAQANPYVTPTKNNIEMSVTSLAIGGKAVGASRLPQTGMNENAATKPPLQMFPSTATRPYSNFSEAPSVVTPACRLSSPNLEPHIVTN